jgi:sec-independent protein translocase protein TatC
MGTAAEMTIWEHIDELRSRVVRIVICITVITLFVSTFGLKPFDYNGLHLAYPFPDPINNISTKVALHMKNSLLPPDVHFIQTAPGQAFFATIYVSILIGILGSLPVIAKEISGFISPAISGNTKKTFLKLLLPSIFLFVAGVAFSYAFVIPFTIKFLYQYGSALGAEKFFNVNDFVSFVMQFFIGFGLAFQLPIIMYAISLTGIISPRFWRSNFRYAVIILAIFGAAITPDGSGVTMWFVAGPMIALYLVGMVAVERKAKREMERERENGESDRAELSV